MTDKRKKALRIYGLVILIILLAIFMIPNSLYLKLYSKNVEKIENANKIEFTDYDTQQERLLKKQYKYEYLLLDSLSDKTYQYKCSGIIDKEVESGTCTEPSRISYTEATKKESLKINTDYVDVSYIIDLLKNVEPEITKYQTSREYNYKVKIEDLDTEIIVYADTDNINKIELSNKYMTYIIKISDVSY